MSEALGLGPAALARANPFHLMVGPDGSVVQCGRSLAQLGPPLVGQPFDEIGVILRPEHRSAHDLRALDGRLCHLQIRGFGFVLRGQWLDDGERMVFVGSPIVTSVEDLARGGLRLANFAVHDPVADYLFILQARDHSLEDIRTLQQRLEVRNRELEAAESDRTRLQAAAAQALHESQEKSSFLTCMSHELRTPLNAIIVYAELIRDEEPQHAEDLGRILDSARRLKALIDDILDLAKVEAGRIDLSLEPVEIGPLVDDLLVALHPVARHKGVGLLRSVRVDAAFTDRKRLQQILANLLANAVRATDAGTVELRVEASGDKVLFEVIDTGCGIGPETLSRLFRPYVQGPESGRVGGTGLGLAISRLLARLLGGDVSVESQVARGSVFTLTLPARGSPAAAGR